jgi:hypothetical protein
LAAIKFTTGLEVLRRRLNAVTAAARTSSANHNLFKSPSPICQCTQDYTPAQRSGEEDQLP